MPEPENGLGFSWSHKTTTSEDTPYTVDETTVDGVISTVKNVVQSVLNTENQTTAFPTTVSTFAQEISTELNEIVKSNNTGLELGTTVTVPVTEMLETTSTTSMSTFVNDATTESSLNTISNYVTTTSPSFSESEENFNEIEDKTLYIVLGVILVALLMILVILLVIYRRYKSRSGIATRVYCVTDLNEVRVSRLPADEVKEQRIVSFN